ncbi:MAG: hypothetical protein WBB85_08445 [Albidovulum sp.]|uniref:hypothetical protein n=1 Tax=Albidovulum sp. TaxID=1872424 RepID=UPI003CB7B190
MARRFLTETDSSGFRALVVGQHQVHDSWDQIQAFLKSKLTAEHAAIFAEPYRGKGSISWMASSDAEPKPLRDLDEETQSAVVGKLTALLADISALAEEMEASNQTQQRQWASLLKDIQRLPAGKNLSEMVYEADGQPILLLWGMRDENSVELSALLTERLIQTQQVRRATAGPAAKAVASGPIAAVGRSFWIWLLWLLFIFILAIILWLLLRACSAGVPAGFSFFGNCASPSIVAEAEDERAELLLELERLRRLASQSPQCRLDSSEADRTIVPGEATDPSRATQVDPKADPNVNPTAETDEPTPIPDFDETDIDRAREEASGQEGDVTVTLLWNGYSDLDLMIDCPGGGRVVKSRGVQTKCGGRVDVDANLCSERERAQVGAVCSRYSNQPQQNPVENAFFFADGAEAGQYKVLVRHYASSKDSANAAVPFVLQIRRGDERKRYQGTIEPGKLDEVARFSVIE